MHTYIFKANVWYLILSDFANHPILKALLVQFNFFIYMYRLYVVGAYSL